MNKYILFDFDGVIVDSFQAAYETNKVICPPLSEDGYRKRFEGNINDWETALDHTAECRHEIYFFTEYLARMHIVTVVPGMPEVVQKLAAEYTLIVISSTISNLIQELLSKNNLLQYFADILGNDVHKSKVEKIKMVFDKYQTTAESCIFITDTLGDMREAAKMNIGSVGVTWGFHMQETLNQGNSFRLVEKPEGILTAIQDYFSK